jgi:two-component system, chemotaxis family, chemotaxis protein CheY
MRKAPYQVDWTKPKILVVEDEDYTRNLTIQILRNIGVRSIAEARDGKAGLMEVVRTRPDIVLCDVHMKPLDGIGFLMGLREIKVQGVDATRVVMLTADANKDTVMLARMQAVVSYLVKPVSLIQLKEKMMAEILSDPELQARVEARGRG